MDVLLVHSNRLSCPLELNGNVRVARSQNFVLPGNMFSQPLPAWVRTKDVRSLSVRTDWKVWRNKIIFVGVGLTSLLILTLMITKGRPLLFICFTPNSRTVRLQLYCAKLLGAWSLALFAVLFPVYYKGSNLYECGKPWLYFSLVYLSDHASAEWGCAVIACAFSGFAVLSVDQLGIVKKVFDNAICPDCKATTPAPRRFFMLLLGWMAVTFVFSIPSMTYALATSLPVCDCPSGMCWL